MRREGLTDQDLDEALRRQPRWEPPRHFAHAVAARRLATSSVPRPARPPRVPMVLRALEAGAAGAAAVYACGVLMLQATPLLVEHATLVAWVTAGLTLSVVAAVTGRVQEWM